MFGAIQGWTSTPIIEAWVFLAENLDKSPWQKLVARQVSLREVFGCFR